MSIIEREYNNANFISENKPLFYSEIKVSILDIINENQVEVKAKDYKDCLCKDKNNINEYFKTCDKCQGKGHIYLNNREVTCNECKGNKYIRVKDCYLCNNNSKVLMDAKVNVKLNKDYKDRDSIILEYEDYKLSLTINIYDKDDYYINGNDIYYLRLVDYSLADYKDKKSVSINTLKGREYVKSEFKCKKEIVCLKNKGIDDGDFYFTFNNEVNNEKKIIYSNVLIDNKGYVSMNSLIDDPYSRVVEYVSIDREGYVYIDDTIDVVENNEYVIHLNKLDNHFKEENNRVVYDLYLDKEDIDSDKKTILVNDERVNVSYKKNLKDVEYVEIVNKGLLDKMGKKSKLIVRVNPYFENTYKIRIKSNNKPIYIEDYKYKDNRLVETFKSDKYLQDYIRVNDEDRVVVGNDIVMIERV